MSMRLLKNHIRRAVGGVERVEYQCVDCQQGFYHFDKVAERGGKHNEQLPHKCTHCQRLTYFTIPYPALYYKGRVFVDCETIRALPPVN